MVEFEYSCSTRIVFGRGRSDDIGEILSSYSMKRVLILIGKGGHVRKTGLLDRVISSMEQYGISYVIFDDVIPNPTLECVRNARKLFLEMDCDFVLSIGGGSVIDVGKAVALSLGVSDVDELWNRCFINYEEVESPIKNGVILTTSASGSETGESAVITNGNKKLIGSSSYATPLFAILDPENTLTLPLFQTACGLADILSHLEERYFTSESSNELSDKMLEAAMRNIIQSGTMLMKYPDDLNLRSNVMWNATIAHNAILDRGRNGGDWACHMIEHEISARFPIAHGEGLSMITPSWLRFASKKAECRDRLMQFAIKVWGSDFPISDDHGIEWAITRQEAWYKELGLRTSLKEIDGFSKINIEEISNSFGYSIGQFLTLSSEDIKEILKEAWS